jgi:hypothetical protein
LGFIVDVYFKLGDFVFGFGNDKEVVSGEDFELGAFIVLVLIMRT